MDIKDKLRLARNLDRFASENRKKYINWCECILLPDGNVQYALPSHTEVLLKIYGKPRETTYTEMPVSASPVYWLMEKTGCIAVYGLRGHLQPLPPQEPTKAQNFALSFLARRGCVSNIPLKYY